MQRHVTRLSARVGAGLLAVAALVAAPTGQASAGPPASGCSSYTTPFAPTTAAFGGVGRGYHVVGVGMASNGALGTPPLSTAGKSMVGWYTPLRVRAGSARGTVVLDAHSWPDGSALGNHLVDGLHVGATVTLTGSHGQRACYVVTAASVYPARRTPFRAIFKRTGAPRVAVITCSGTRLGPGNWTTRTVWYASLA